MKTKHSRTLRKSAGKTPSVGTITKTSGNNHPNWIAHYEDAVVKHDLPKLGVPVKKQIRHAIESKILRDPYTFGKPLRYGKIGQRSLRVGDYRILYIIKEEINIIAIVAIGHRRDIYKE